MSYRSETRYVGLCVAVHDVVASGAWPPTCLRFMTAPQCLSCTVLGEGAGYPRPA